MNKIIYKILLGIIFILSINITYANNDIEKINNIFFDYKSFHIDYNTSLFQINKIGQNKKLLISKKDNEFNENKTDDEINETIILKNYKPIIIQKITFIEKNRQDIKNKLFKSINSKLVKILNNYDLNELYKITYFINEKQKSNIEKQYYSSKILNNEISDGELNILKYEVILNILDNVIEIKWDNNIKKPIK